MIFGKVRRARSTPLGTPGRLSLEQGFACDTLELPWHNNERGKSCTAPGVDRGRVWFSPMLKRLVVRFEDRNGRRDVLVHNGNWAADETDIDGDGVREITQVHGCTEVGRGYGDILRRDGRKQWGILHSVPTLSELIASLKIEGAHQGIGLDGFAIGYHEVNIEYLWEAGIP